MINVGYSDTVAGALTRNCFDNGMFDGKFESQSLDIHGFTEERNCAAWLDRSRIPTCPVPWVP